MVSLECGKAPYSNGREAETRYPIGVGFLLLYIYRLSRRHRAPKDPHQNNHDPKNIYKKQKGPPIEPIEVTDERRF